MRVRASVTSKDRGWRALMKVATDIKSGAYVKVGVLDDGKGSESHGALTNAELAGIHEFGTADGHVPARPFIRSTFEAQEATARAMLKKLIGGLVSGGVTLDQSLGLVGLFLATEIRKTVTDGEGVPPPNAPSTIARKGSDRPLVDTAQMINSVSWLVVTGEGVK